MPPHPRILSISFSEFVADARVLRQLNVLAQHGEVTTIGYGPKPALATEHIELAGTPASLPQTPGGVAKLAFRRFRAAELAAPANRMALELLADRSFDMIVANEARALPLAFAVAKGAPVWGDMHEWAPEERTHVLSWRLLVGPLMRYICKTYLGRAAAVTTVNDSIAALYREQFGCTVEVVRNSIPLTSLTPSPVSADRIRLVHSGGAVPGRNLEALIDATLMLDERFTLDLFLIGARDGGRYLEELKRHARNDGRVVFHDPVSPAELPGVLNAYDLGVYLLPPLTTNHRLMLPNKFFDFVQGRVGLVFNSSVETDALIRKHNLGVIVEGTSGERLAEALGSLNREDVSRFKANVDAAAPLLSSAADEETESRLIARLLAEG